MVSICFTVKLSWMSLFEALIHVCARFRDMTRMFLVMRATGNFYSSNVLGFLWSGRSRVCSDSACTDNHEIRVGYVLHYTAPNSLELKHDTFSKSGWLIGQAWLLVESDQVEIEWWHDTSKKVWPSCMWLHYSGVIRTVSFFLRHLFLWSFSLQER